MDSTKRLLVVDDEQVVLLSCKRIFEAEGFAVDTSNDSQEGLKKAQSEEYSAVLLDIKMPVMDGIEFLKELRGTNPDLPVLMITGYASIPTASAAMRLGAVDYIPKPFTPDEIKQAVHRVVGPHPTRPGMRTTGRGAAEVPARLGEWEAATRDIAFVDEAWSQLGQDGTVRVGMFLLRSEAGSLDELHMPRVGDILHQGLPQATFLTKEGNLRLVPSPLSGEVVEVNQSLKDDPTIALKDPCHAGWVARVEPTEPSEEIYPREARKLLLFSLDSDEVEVLRTKLEHFGCTVASHTSAEEVLATLKQAPYPLVVVDARSTGDAGPRLIARINRSFDFVKVLVLAEPSAQSEAAYRTHKIFYYAVDPFTDLEIIDILSAAYYRPIFPSAGRRLPAGRPQTVGKLRITCHDGTIVTLLVDGAILKEDRGLGLQLTESSLGDRYPIEVGLGVRAIDPPYLAKEGEQSDRIFILKAVDKNHLPGSLVIDTHGHGLDWLKDKRAQTVAVLEVQPNPVAEELLSFDARTTIALAKHILHEMTA